MPDFKYIGIDPSGNKVCGSTDANSRKEAILKIKFLGIKLIKISEPKETMNLKASKIHDKKNPQFEKTVKRAKNFSYPWSFFNSKKRKYSKRVGLEFYKQLMELHESGLPVADAIRILNKRTSDPVLKKLYGEIWDALSSGNSLAQSLMKYPELFDLSLVKVIEASASTGSVIPILKRIIEYLEEQAEIKKKITSSLSYPAFICFMAGGVVLFFVFYLLPQIRGMLDSLGGEMSWSAKLLLDGSEFGIVIFPYLVGLIFLIFASLMAWIKTGNGKDFMDRWMLRVPLLGSILYYRSLYQTIHLITTLLENKIHTTECLKMAEKTLTNLELREQFSNARKMVVEGASFSNAFERNQILPPINIDILRVGEETGSLVNALTKIANQFRNRLTDKLQFATTLISSFALFFAFSLVALIALGIVTSIFQVSRSINM